MGAPTCPALDRLRGLRRFLRDSSSIEGNSQIRDTEDSTAFVKHPLLNHLIRSRQ